MTSVGVDVGVMWRLSEDFNRRFVARVQHHHRPGVSMLYNGTVYCADNLLFHRSFLIYLFIFIEI